MWSWFVWISVFMKLASLCEMQIFRFLILTKIWTSKTALSFLFAYKTTLLSFKALSDQPVVDTATATEQAKMLIKSGAISAIKSENKNSGFKRSRMLEIKLKVRHKSSVFILLQEIWWHLAYNCHLRVGCFNVLLLYIYCSSILFLFFPSSGPWKRPSPCFLTIPKKCLYRWRTAWGTVDIKHDNNCLSSSVSSVV